MKLILYILLIFSLSSTTTQAAPINKSFQNVKEKISSFCIRFLNAFYKKIKNSPIRYNIQLLLSIINICYDFKNVNNNTQLNTINRSYPMPPLITGLTYFLYGYCCYDILESIQEDF